MAPPPTRSEEQVLDLIVAVARAEPRVRAAILSGSRADPGARVDGWRDFDVVYVVVDVAAFRADPAWIDVFGERAMLQRPDVMFGSPPRADGGEAYLMLFVDGHRIDLTLLPVAAMADFRHDGPASVLFDLDGVVPEPPAPGAPHHVPEPPTAASFADVCNEFWWVVPYVAKGLARGELGYAHHHLDTVLRAQLLTMLGWEVAAASGFRRGPGKAGRDLRRLLAPTWWARLEATYADAVPAHGWAALDAMSELFRLAAMSVADRYGLPYPRDEDAGVTAHLRRMRPPAAPEPEPLLAELEDELAAWEALLAGRSPRALRAPRSAGGWSVQDVVAHLAAWQQVSNARLAAALSGADPEMPAWLGGGDPEDEGRVAGYNARIFAERSGLAWSAVRRDWRGGFRRLIGAAAALPAAELGDPDRFPWLGGHPLRAVLEGTLGHHREHRETVMGWFAVGAGPPHRRAPPPRTRMLVGSVSPAAPLRHGARPARPTSADDRPPPERSPTMKITIETTVAAPIDDVWRAWTTPADIERWNAASDDWHTTAASVDLRPGGTFTSRMEAKDGSAGFDFTGTYTRVDPQVAIEYVLEDGRFVAVEFREEDGVVRVTETFDAESTHTAEQQRAGWQAILDGFARYVESRR